MGIHREMVMKVDVNDKELSEVITCAEGLSLCAG